MKQHGIASSGGVTGVKKEAKEAKDPKDSPTKQRKKRKLAKVEDDVGDIDEPVKGEVKNEDAIPVKTELVKSEAGATVGVKSENVKTEHDVAAAVAGLGTEASTSSPGAGAVGAQNNDDDDDEVLVVSATQKSDSSAPMLGFSDVHRHRQHTHAHSHSHSLMPTTVPGVHSFDYGANMKFPTQTMTAMTTMTPTMPQASSNSSSYPYGFGPSPWFHSHDAASSIYGGHGHFWQGISTQEPQHQQNHPGEDHDTAMEG